VHIVFATYASKKYLSFPSILTTEERTQQKLSFLCTDTKKVSTTHVCTVPTTVDSRYNYTMPQNFRLGRFDEFFLDEKTCVFSTVYIDSQYLRYDLHGFLQVSKLWSCVSFRLRHFHGYTWAVSIHMGENFVHSMPVQYFFQAIKIHRRFIRRTHYVDNYRVFYRCQDLCHGKTILTWISTGTIVLSPGK
jgi:hypothetical protein